MFAPPPWYGKHPTHRTVGWRVLNRATCTHICAMATRTSRPPKNALSSAMRARLAARREHNRTVALPGRARSIVMLSTSHTSDRVVAIASSCARRPCFVMAYGSPRK
jgi:hypothetical protein